METNPSLDILASEERQRQLEAIKTELNFISIDAIDERREQTEEVAAQAREAILADPAMDFLTAYAIGYDAAKKAERAVYEAKDTEIDTYLTSHGLNKDDNPELFERAGNLLRNTSNANMLDIKWTTGDIDDKHELVEGSATGKELAEAEFESICEDVLASRKGPEVDLNAERADCNAKLQTLKTARDALAEAKLNSSSMIRKRGSRAKNVRENLDLRKEAYDKALKDAGVAIVGLLRAEGLSDDEINTEVHRGAFAEVRARTEAEVAIAERDQSLKARMVRKIARMSGGLFLSDAVGGFALGYGTNKALKTGLMVALAPAGAVGLGVLVAVKSTGAVVRASIGNKIRNEAQFGRRAQEDIEAVGKRIGELLSSGSHTDEELADMTVKTIRQNLEERVEKTRKGNRNRVVMSGAVAGAAALGGAALAQHYNNVHHTPSGGKPGTGGSTPPGGGAGTPPSLPPAVNNAGFNPSVLVEHGHGYTQELQELAAQKGVKLTGPESFRLYQHLTAQNNGNMFTNIGSYARKAGGLGISRPGAATWRPETLQAVDAWLKASGKS